MIGRNNIFEDDTEITSILNTGDDCFFGKGVRLLNKKMTIGDYSKIHRNSLIFGKNDIKIGHNFWLGQNSVLNSDAELIIEDNVRIGFNTNIWTHIAGGELIEGCNLFRFKPVHIKKNVWILGNCTISPGVILEENTVILPGSVITKNTKKNTTYGGTPAKEVSIVPYTPVGYEEKTCILYEYLKEWDGISFAFPDLILKDKDGITRFNLLTKTYNKRYTEEERKLIKHLINFKARFVPDG